MLCGSPVVMTDIPGGRVSVRLNGMGKRMIDPKLIEKMIRNEADMAFKRRVKTIFEYVQPRAGMLILDLPCGRGYYINMFRHVSDCRIIGADLDWQVLLKAKRNLACLSDISLQRVNIYDIPFRSGCFDAVIYSEVLEHIEDDRRALREAFRILKPGGTLAVTVPHANYPFWWDPINKTLESLFQVHIQHGPLAGIWANHVRLYERPELRAALEDANFEIADERAFTHHCFPFIHNLVYGIGKPLLESGFLPTKFAKVADRSELEHEGSRWNPIKLGIGVLNAFDRKNVDKESGDRATLNLAVKGIKPRA